MKSNDLAFTLVGAINAKQVTRLSSPMAEDRRFIDSDGSESRGCGQMSGAWHHYFEMVPDYRIEVHEVLTRGDAVTLLGTADGTSADRGTLDPANHWSIPAARKVVVRDERVAVWQLCLNAEPMRISRAPSTSTDSRWRTRRLW